MKGQKSMPAKKETRLQRRMKELGDKMTKDGAFVGTDEIDSWKAQRQMIQESVVQAKEHIAKHPQPHEQMLFSFMPTDMTRTSPFFPMNRREMKDRPFESLTWETAWGKITFEGRRLAIYDESILFILLSLAAKHRGGTFLTTQHEICKRAGVKAATNTYNAIWQSIDRMAGTKVSLETWKGKGRNRKAVLAMTGTIISWAGKDEKTGKLKVIFNPYFLEMYAESFITNIDYKFRRSLRSDPAKALYRFYRSQKGMGYSCHILTLAQAVNLNIDLPMKKLRDRIRVALRELKSKGYLSKWTMTKDHVVSVWKAVGRKS